MNHLTVPLLQIQILSGLSCAIPSLISGKNMRDVAAMHVEQAKEFSSIQKLNIEQNARLQRELEEERQNAAKCIEELRQKGQIKTEIVRQELQLTQRVREETLRKLPLKYPPECLNQTLKPPSHPEALIIFDTPLDWCDAGAKDFSKPRGIKRNLDKFIEEYYPSGGQDRPVIFFCGALERSLDPVETRILWWSFQDQPGLILETHIDEEDLDLRLTYWVPGSECRSRYIETKNKITSENRNDFRNILSFYHKLVTSLMIDAHHVIHSNSYPLFPKLLPGLIKEISYIWDNDEENIKSFHSKIAEVVTSAYQSIYIELSKRNKNTIIPNLEVELAQSLTCLSNKLWARKHLDSSIQWFLGSHGVSQVDGDPLDVMRSLCLKDGDKLFLQALQRSLLELEDNVRAAKVGLLLEQCPVPKLIATSDNASSRDNKQSPEVKISYKFGRRNKL